MGLCPRCGGARVVRDGPPDRAATGGLARRALRVLERDDEWARFLDGHEDGAGSHLPSDGRTEASERSAAAAVLAHLGDADLEVFVQFIRSCRGAGWDLEAFVQQAARRVRPPRSVMDAVARLAECGLVGLRRERDNRGPFAAVVRAPTPEARLLGRVLDRLSQD